jgi:isoaspartyl peptidase/L-asparaginase-like protein (Ntn-hydrolase superfamily)
MMEPIVISTWNHGLAANARAMEILKNGGNSLDAVEEGVKVAEADPDVLSVGYGGLPDNAGRVTLDAAIMDWKARIGSVIFLEHFKHPVSVARKILEDTEHTILAGDGAYQFALLKGFNPESLLTEYSIKRYKEWKKNGSGKAEEAHTKDFKLNPKKNKPGINDDGNHDTIGMVALDKDGHISAAWKGW